MIHSNMVILDSIVVRLRLKFENEFPKKKKWLGRIL